MVCSVWPLSSARQYGRVQKVVFLNALDIAQGQNMRHHEHVYWVVPGGGPSEMANGGLLVAPDRVIEEELADLEAHDIGY